MNINVSRKGKHNYQCFGEKETWIAMFQGKRNMTFHVSGKRKTEYPWFRGKENVTCFREKETWLPLFQGKEKFEYHLYDSGNSAVEILFNFATSLCWDCLAAVAKKKDVQKRCLWSAYCYLNGKFLQGVSGKNNVIFHLIINESRKTDWFKQ